MNTHAPVETQTAANNPSRLLATIAALWAGAVVLLSISGLLARIPPPAIAAIVATGIVLPAIWYYRSLRLRRYAELIGHQRIMALHTWRIPAALVFFWYGVQGGLPTAFWVLAGVGDFMVGALALYYLSEPESIDKYRRFHRFGLTDFVIAVGTGLTFTLLNDPRMALITTLPMALIPLYGVGISGATHLIAFDMLKRGVGLTNRR